MAAAAQLHWFDYNDPDQHRLVFLQGDTRHAKDPSDGVIGADHKDARAGGRDRAGASAATY